MAQKPAPKKVYRTSNGKIVDMDLLRQKNELTPAVGNVRVNARGDELGPGGKIVRKREDILKDFYAQADAEAAATAAKKQPAPATKSVSAELFDDEEE
jgi:hypothetical protein